MRVGGGGVVMASWLKGYLGRGSDAKKFSCQKYYGNSGCVTERRTDGLTKLGMIGGTISLTIPKLKNMEEGLVSPH